MSDVNRPGASNRPPWRRVMEFADDAKVARADITARYKHLARHFHPDMPTGSHEEMAQLNEARDAAPPETGT